MNEALFEIPFTQFFMPDCRQVQTSIKRPKEIHDKAIEIIGRGGRFTAVYWQTGEVSVALEMNNVGYDIELTSNKSNVSVVFDTLVKRVYESLIVGGEL